jgi:hypothetical protein
MTPAERAAAALAELVAAMNDRDKAVSEEAGEHAVRWAGAERIAAEAARDQAQAKRDDAKKETAACRARREDAEAYVRQCEGAVAASLTGSPAKATAARVTLIAAQDTVTERENALSLAVQAENKAQRDLDTAVKALEAATIAAEDAKLARRLPDRPQVTEATLALIAAWYDLPPNYRPAGLPELTTGERERAFGYVRTAFFSMSSEANWRYEHARPPGR